MGIMTLIIGILIVGWLFLFGFSQLLRRGFFTSGTLGVGTLCLLSSIFGASHAVLGINLLTLSLSFFLGVPGVLGLLLLRMVVG